MPRITARGVNSGITTLVGDVGAERRRPGAFSAVSVAMAFLRCGAASGTAVIQKMLLAGMSRQHDGIVSAARAGGRPNRACDRHAAARAGPILETDALPAPAAAFLTAGLRRWRWPRPASRPDLGRRRTSAATSRSTARRWTSAWTTSSTSRPRTWAGPSARTAASTSPWTSASAAYTLRGLMHTIRVAPVREMASEWEQEALKMLGRDVEVTGVFVQGNVSQTQRGSPSARRAVLELPGAAGEGAHGRDQVHPGDAREARRQPGQARRPDDPGGGEVPRPQPLRRPARHAPSAPPPTGSSRTTCTRCGSRARSRRARDGSSTPASSATPASGSR